MMPDAAVDLAARLDRIQKLVDELAKVRGDAVNSNLSQNELTVRFNPRGARSYQSSRSSAPDTKRWQLS
jgi:hypothetical protein